MGAVGSGIELNNWSMILIQYDVIAENLFYKLNKNLTKYQFSNNLHIFILDRV